MSVVGIAILGEDWGHFRAATRLIDDACVTAHRWLDGILDDCRTWQGRQSGDRWYKYDPEDAFDVRPFTIDGIRIAPQGWIAGEPLKTEAGMWRKALLMFVHAKPRPDVVVIVRDLDGYPRRLEGLEQVRNGLAWPFPIVAATPEPEIEAWHVAGFVPTGDAERSALAQLRSRLSFDPTTASHRLTSHPNDADTDAKRVMSVLCGEDVDRHAACLVDHALLKARGRTNHLTRFIDEVHAHVVPLFGAAP